MSKLSDHPKSKDNPFLEEAVQHLEKKNKKIGVVESGQELIDTDTGEVVQHTNAIYTRKYVDTQQFVKLYTGNVQIFFELGKTGAKVFQYILEMCVKINKDQILINIQEAIEHTGYSTKASIYEGLADLCDKKILHRSEQNGVYFINPQIVFNGDRMVVLNEFIKKKDNQGAEDNKRLISRGYDNGTEHPDQEQA